MADRKYEVLREVYRVTQYKEGAVFKTEFVETKWVPMDEPPPPGFQYVVVSDPTVLSIRRVL